MTYDAVSRVQGVTLPTSEGEVGRRTTVRLLSVNRILRETLVAALSQAHALDVFGACDLLDYCADADPGPDVLLLDMCHHGVQVIHGVRECFPKAKIVAFGVADPDRAILGLAAAGVSGLASLSASVAELVGAVEAAARGELLCTPKMAGMLLNHVHVLAARERAVTNNGGLTMREREIASLMGQGLSNKQIARSLKVQNATVKNHVHSILGKFGVHRRGEITARLQMSTTVDTQEV